MRDGWTGKSKLSNWSKIAKYKLTPWFSDPKVMCEVCDYIISSFRKVAWRSKKFYTESVCKITHSEEVHIKMWIL